MFVSSLTFIACYRLTILVVVFFGHLTPAVEDLRYQHVYHPVPVEQKSPALAQVLNEISSGLFGDRGVYEP
jgi:starch phosphorylase